MSSYLLKRITTMFITIIGVSILVFMIIHLIPGNPVNHILGDYATEESIQELESRLGLDRPITVQYLSYMASAFQGDLGTSFITGYTVVEEIMNRIPVTAQLAFYSILFGSVLGISIGILAAVKKNTIYDQLAMTLALIGISAPGFWIALFLILLFSYQLSIFPISGYSGFYSLILPSITLGLGTAGSIARMTRSSMLDVIKQDYIRTARAKGAGAYRLIFQHCLQNAVIPVITLIGMQFGYLMAGAVVTETVYALPGLGSLIIAAISTRDIPTVQGLLLFMGSIIILVNFIVDLLYTKLDPRIQYE
ncbi:MULTISPECIES: ABC transporter permease [unclassified Psychrobacillus]|uniref:ABC transporter permease n=1 Tax=unclassified Psychrobacillus TaxID=2636677 RepID=UPI00146A3179|nr:MULTISPECIES: ABC transporter permease [unclassified Psychrobacillus]MCM3356493.1 ABC transporter permease [Psychrobacillus sp. MER TA 171]NME05780.1 ABC transporter permease [Psychrobacillus sp. BL-248-WT-3]